MQCIFFVLFIPLCVRFFHQTFDTETACHKRQQNENNDHLIHADINDDRYRTSQKTAEQLPVKFQRFFHLRLRKLQRPAVSMKIRFVVIFPTVGVQHNPVQPTV